MDENENQVCENCSNIYQIVWVEKGENYNDYGLRYCPYCGILTDLLPIPR